MKDYSLDLVLRFDEVNVSVHNQEPSRYLFEHSGELELVDEVGFVVETIGSFSAFAVDVVAALVDEESLFDVFDSHAITVGYFENLYELNGGDFKEKVIEAVGGENFLWNPKVCIARAGLRATGRPPLRYFLVWYHDV